MIQKRYFALAAGLLSVLFTVGCNRNACISGCGAPCGDVQGCGTVGGCHGVGAYYDGVSPYHPRDSYYSDAPVEKLRAPEPIRSKKATQKIRVRETPAVTVSQPTELPLVDEKSNAAEKPLDVQSAPAQPHQEIPVKNVPDVNPVDAPPAPAVELPVQAPAKKKAVVSPEVIDLVEPLEKKPAPPKQAPATVPVVQDPIEIPSLPASVPVQRVVPVSASQVPDLPELSMPKLP